MILTKELILTKTTEEEIFQIFMHTYGGRFAINTNIKNPLRTDNNASCRIYYNKRSIPLFFDPSFPEFNGDCFNFVRLCLNLDNNPINFKEVLKEIDGMLNLNLAPTSFGKNIRVKAASNVKPLQVIRKQMFPETKVFKHMSYNQITHKGSEFFQMFGIERKDLSHFCVSQVHKFWFGLEKKQKIWNFEEHGLIFAYPIVKYIEENNELKKDGTVFYQIYRPEAARKSDKFRTNAEGSPMLGYQKLPKKGEVVFITSSYKDIITLHTQGIVATAPMGEATNIPSMYIRDLKKRFKKIVINFDNDLAGRTAANKLLEKHPEFDLFLTPSEIHKDISEYQFYYGDKKTKILLSKYIDD